ncbi:MAG: acetolactate synthase large subunit [Caldilineaceae bacterium]|nr:acetolactate synthase large subunit [Caldilineaceae bacterium]
MNGAEALLQTARTAGLEVCFTNPGTTELPLVLALEQIPGMRAVLGLFEGVCTGAADGYARMAGKPALTLLHLGPGLANGVANLHNARRADTPVVNLIGQHATWHLAADPPLAMDIEQLAGTYGSWARSIQRAEDIGRDTAAAIEAARTGRSATLIVPHDLQIAEAGPVATAVAACDAAPVDPGQIERAAKLLRESKRPAMLLGGRALQEHGLRAAARIQAATGCALWADPGAGRVERGGDLPDVPRVPYFPEQALAALEPFDAFVLVDARRPVAFFGYPGGPSYFIRDDQTMLAIGAGQDGGAVLAALATALDAAVPARQDTGNGRPDAPGGPLTGQSVGQVLASCYPDQAILINEGVTTGQAFVGMGTHGLPRHTLLSVTGGAIGFGLPCAVGAAIACPERPVIALQADGSAAYTVQALWTMAREALNVTVLLCSNRRYKILEIEMSRAGISAPGATSRRLTELSQPAIDWVTVSQGFGVPAARVETGEALAQVLRRAVKEPGPMLIEMEMV